MSERVTRRQGRHGRRACGSRLLAPLMLVAFSSLVGVFFAEAAVRLVRPQAVLQVPNDLYQATADGRFELRPSAQTEITNRVEFDTRATVNSLGLRGSEPQSTGPRRLLAIGDSYTFGIGVEDDETYVARLPAQMQDAGRPMVTLNGGVPGYGVPDAVAWYERHGEAVDADVVLLAICVANDLLDAAQEDVEIVYGFARRGGSRPGIGEWLYQHSHLFVFLKTAVPAGSYQRLRGWLGLPPTLAQRNLERELEIYLRQPSARIEAGARATGAALDRLSELTRQRHQQLVALLVPTLLQVSSERWQGAVAQVEGDRERYDRRAPTRLLRELLAARGISTLDLTALLAAAEEGGERPYFPIDRHWTPRGHQLAAAALASWLADMATAAAAGPTESGS